MPTNNTEANNTTKARDKDWERLKEFEADGLVVIVSKLPIKIPRYSIEITFRTPFGERKIGRHLQVKIDRDLKSNTIKVEPIAKETLVNLITQAEKFIESQEENDMFLFLEWKKSLGNTSIEKTDTDDDEVLIERKNGK